MDMTSDTGRRVKVRWIRLDSDDTLRRVSRPIKVQSHVIAYVMSSPRTFPRVYLMVSTRHFRHSIPVDWNINDPTLSFFLPSGKSLFW